MPAASASVDELGDLVRHADADRVPEADLVRAELDAAGRATSTAVARRRPRPVYGQPNAVDTYARRHQPSSPARARTGANAASDSSTVIPMLCWVNASVAAVKTAMASTPAGLRAGQPALVRDEDRVPDAGPPRQRAPISSSASASCGMARGDTNDVASISRSPASTSSSMKRSLDRRSGRRPTSFWRPSRGPTS